ncbi:MAG TPA: ABC transporter substrate-binding protein [Aggregatilinea sp.]|jgi:peptide/nickel transport system substrate-binding protein|uniref:ABC transporter substrate-binding protein n=1 Tax=Aggregatilinea sp. TaxID=2806333 RepID=UPI002C30C6C0|nr:ABC transporter substrate-binding protein [Aggregatilinea sp.]HML20921.1 ABC transporter substrate-binding protein [Aggregatilinea sp.]
MNKYTLSRRQFLKQAAAVTAATALPAQVLGAPATVLAAPRRQEVAPGVPREECLILENPSGTVLPADDFNRWRSGYSAVWVSGLQQLALDALWYIDPDAGVDGVWDNALAAEKPIYNEDFTQMTVKLREGIYWSDGVEFTADDLYFTVDLLKNTPGMQNQGLFESSIDHMEQPDRNTVIFYLTAPNSRFHSAFTVRWGALYMLPKHIWESVEDPVAFTFNPPISLGAYVLKDFDPNGKWFLWERREDWQRTSLARLGDVSVKYAMYIDPGPSDKRVIAQMSQELDVIHDITPEGRITLAKENPTSVGWFPSFPWAHPDPTLPAVIYNNEKPGLDKKEVRWALTLAIDIVQVALASYRGAATISAIHVPPTGMYPEYYHAPLEPWLNDFTIKVGGEDYKPYDPTIAQQIADVARESLGDLVPTDPEIIKQYIGAGWWKHDLDAAEQLMLDAGMQKKDGKWALPDGSEFKVPLMSMNETNPTMNRAAAMVAENWAAFGIDTTLDAQANPWPIMTAGEYSANLAWTIETWGGHPDLFFFLQYWHSRLYVPSGQDAAGSNSMRWKNPELDRIIEEIETISFDDPKGIELGQEFCKLAVQEMPITPLMAYNVFTTMDTTYFTGYPSIDDPYTDPVPNWGNTKYMFVKIKPKAM